MSSSSSNLTQLTAFERTFLLSAAEKVGRFGPARYEHKHAQGVIAVERSADGAVSWTATAARSIATATGRTQLPDLQGEYDAQASAHVQHQGGGFLDLQPRRR